MMKRITKRIVSLSLIVFAGLPISSIFAEQGTNKVHADLVLGVLDHYMNAVNRADFDAVAATYHFPHFRVANGTLTLWDTPAQALPMLLLPIAERRQALREGLASDWQRTEWVSQDIVAINGQQANVATEFVRLDSRGEVIVRVQSLYVLVHRAGRWGIVGRSSFAP